MNLSEASAYLILKTVY